MTNLEKYQAKICLISVGSLIVNGKLVQPDPAWRHGCEQHLAFIYPLQPIDKQLTPSLNERETTDVGWFSLVQVKQLDEISADIREEIMLAMEISGAQN